MAGLAALGGCGKSDTGEGTQAVKQRKPKDLQLTHISLTDVPPEKLSEKLEKPELDEARIDLLEVAQSLEPEALGPLLAHALTDSSEAVRVQAVMLAPSLPLEEAANLLLEALFNSSERVRGVALAAIAGLPVEERILIYEPALASVIDPSPESGNESVPEDVQMAICSDVSRLWSKDAFPLILMMLCSPNEQCAVQAHNRIYEMVGLRFENCSQAIAWWESSRDSYNENMELYGRASR